MTPPEIEADGSAPVRRVLSAIGRYWPWLALGAVLLAVAVIRVRLLMIPLERDEGEYAYMGQLLLQGIPPYKLAYNMKFPGTYAAYALIMALFGQTIAGIHTGLLLVNLISAVMVFLLARRLFGRSAAVMAAASFAFLTVSQTVVGTSAHATQFVLPFVLGGCLLLLRLRDTGRPVLALWSGVLFGIAVLMKQHAALFVVFAGLYVLYIRSPRGTETWKPLASQCLLLLLLGGALLPFAATCLVLYAAGVFGSFWFWTLTYAREYVSALTPAQGVQMFLREFKRIFALSSELWVMAAWGLLAAVRELFADAERRADTAFFAGFALFSFLAICPGFFFRNHYFVLVMPAVGMAIALFITRLERFLSRAAGRVAGVAAAAGLFVFALAYAAYSQSDFLFRSGPEQACRIEYGLNPFPESVEIGDYIREHTAKTDTIAVIGSEPQIYFYSGRRSATGFIYMYALMEKQKYALKMQQDMIGEITRAKPKYVVITNVPTSWMISPGSDLTILRWASEYFPGHYDVVGIINAPASGSSASVSWNVAPRADRVMDDFSTWVMARKD